MPPSPDFPQLADVGTIIDDPDLLLGQTSPHEVGTLYGKPWNNKDAIAFIQKNQASLPHLQDILITFFKGALQTWQDFTWDICNNPKATEATPEQCRIAFRHPANDLNEGVLGLLRRKYCAFPNITFNMVNMKLMSR